MRLLRGFLENFGWVWDRKLYGYPLGESLGDEGGAEKVACNGRLYGNEGGKLDVSPLEESLGEDGGYEIGSSSGM